jgi:quinol monooxygenase YgiN
MINTAGRQRGRPPSKGVTVMVVIRNVFRCKPGKAKALVTKFKETIAGVQHEGLMKNARVMTDVAAGFWTVVLETEAESLEAWENEFRKMGEDPRSRKGMEGYMELVEGGHREIFRLE